MNSFSRLKKDVIVFLRKNQIQPSKKLGQNFLIDKKIISTIIKNAQLDKKDIILEIGPGTGILTKELVSRAKLVIAVEKDQKISEALKKNFGGLKNLKILQGDILKIKNLNLKNYHFKIVANLPYYITMPVIRKFLEKKPKPKLMILMVQKEVAQRICAKPPKMNLLAVSVQFFAKPEIISYVSKNAFWPSPKVDSAIIKIEPKIEETYSLKFKNLFFKIIKAGFSQPRKILINNLCRNFDKNKEKLIEIFQRNNINPFSRAENLNLEEWLKITKNLFFYL